MVRTMQVEDVHTGGLEAAEGGVHLFENTLSLEIYQNNEVTSVNVVMTTSSTGLRYCGCHNKKVGYISEGGLSLLHHFIF